MSHLSDIIALGEGFTTEFKRSGTAHLGRELCAFANATGGVILIGVEIVSPGGLPAGMTPELLGIKSIPRNPLLFGMLYRMNAVEQVGSGVRRIREICRDYGVPEPDYEINDHWVTMTFKRPELVNGVRVSDETDGTTQKTTHAAGEAGGPMGGLIGGLMGSPIELSKRQAQLLDLIRNDSKLSKIALAEKLGINPSAVQKHLEVLKKKGVLRRIGGTRGHWEVSNHVQ